MTCSISHRQRASAPSGHSVGSYSAHRCLASIQTPSEHRGIGGRSVSLLRFISLASLFVSVRSQIFPSTIDLSTLDGTIGCTVNGVSAGDQSGFSVSNAGDVNADGMDDFLIGAPQADPGGRVDSGKNYLVFGRKGFGAGGTFDLSSLDGTTGFALNGVFANDRSGTHVSSAGDVNGDGVSDLIVATRYADPGGLINAGQTYVVFGRAGLGGGGTFDLSSLDGTTGFTLSGSSADISSGYSASSAGDVNGDGIGDLVIGASSADPGGRNDAGQTYVVFGRSGLGSGGSFQLSSLDGTNGFVLNGAAANENSGNSVSGAGDVNGDGVADLLIGAFAASPAGRSDAGKTYVVFGSAGLGSSGTVELSGLNGSTGFTINGAAANDRSGISVSSAGDLNSDGIGDILIGAHQASPGGRSGAGQSYVVFGARGIGSGGTMELSSLSGTNGFVLNGVYAGSNSGFSLSLAGDVNGDGVGDIIIGANLADVFGRDDAGQSYVVFGGRNVGSGGVVNLQDLDGTNGFALSGATNNRSGFSVSGAGDVNDDGVDDILIGSYQGSPLGRSEAGTTQVVFGRKSVVTTITSSFIVAPTTTSKRVTLLTSTKNTALSDTVALTSFSRGSTSTKSDGRSFSSSITALDSTSTIGSSIAMDDRTTSRESLTTQSTNLSTLEQSTTYRVTASEPGAVDWKLIAGVAGGVAALCLSILGGVVACMRSSSKNRGEVSDSNKVEEPVYGSAPTLDDQYQQLELAPAENSGTVYSPMVMQ